MVVVQWKCSCGHRHDWDALMAQRPAGALPRPRPDVGDLSMCVFCGVTFRFRDEAEPVPVEWSTVVQLLIASGQHERLTSMTRLRAVLRSAN